MNVYLWFFVVTTLSTIGGIVLFRVLFSRPDFPWSDQVGAGIAGAFLGAFAGLIALATYDVSDSSFGRFGVPTLMGAAFSVVIQKMFADMTLEKLISGDSDDSTQ